MVLSYIKGRLQPQQAYREGRVVAVQPDGALRIQLDGQVITAGPLTDEPIRPGDYVTVVRKGASYHVLGASKR